MYSGTIQKTSAASSGSGWAEYCFTGRSVQGQETTDVAPPANTLVVLLGSLFPNSE